MLPQLLLLSLLFANVDSIWEPDDVASSASSASSAHNIVTAMSAIQGQDPYEDANILRELTTEEGSGRTEDISADDYTDDDKWAEEGQDQMMQNLEHGFVESPVLGDSKTQSKGSSELEGRPVSDNQDNDRDTGNKDMFFEEDPEDVLNETLQWNSPKPDPELKSSLDTRSERENLAFVTSSQSDVSKVMSTISISKAPPLTANVTPSPRGITASATTGRPPVVMTTQQVHPSPSDDIPKTEEHLPVKTSFVHHAEGHPSANTDEEAVEEEVEESQRAIPGVKKFGAVVSESLASSTSSPQIQTTTMVSTFTSTPTAITKPIYTPASETTPSFTRNLSPPVFPNKIAKAGDTDSNPRTDSKPGERITNETINDSVPSTTGSSQDSDFDPPELMASDPSTTSSSPVPPVTSPSPPPPCLQECNDIISSFQLKVTPSYSMAQQGVNVSLRCWLTKPAESDPSEELFWRFESDNGSSPCSLGPSGAEEGAEQCAELEAEAAEEFENRTDSVIRLTVPEATTAHSGKYACVVTANCCEGTAHTQKIQRNSEVAVIKIYGKSTEKNLRKIYGKYGVQLAALSVLCLFLLTGILGSAGIQRRPPPEEARSRSWSRVL
ncbi:histone H3.v1-like [Amphibalanus amphitrite]|uniref:histone H3.v1-like n=1 Tax=Amphibalanus amphitrite TaxID=1232801 RepID=UPI001C90E83E|nr:histone H3.v1-like [Amphibalanus amphitrite]